MRSPPGSLESVAEEISASPVSRQRSANSSLEECHQRAFLTANGTFFLAFSAGLAAQVEIARVVPARLRGLTSILPVASGLLAGVETYRHLSNRCQSRNSRVRRRHFSDSTLPTHFSKIASRTNGVGSFESVAVAAASGQQESPLSDKQPICESIPEQLGHQVVRPPQIPVWNHITESHTAKEASPGFLPGLP